MFPANLLLGFLLLFSVGHTYRICDCFEYSVTRPGFEGRITNYNDGGALGDKSCSSLLTPGVNKVIQEVAGLRSINFEKSSKDVLYGVKIPKTAAAELKGSFYAPLDGTYTFTMTTLSYSLIIIRGVFDDTENEFKAFYFCAPSTTTAGSKQFTVTLSANTYYPIEVMFIRAAEAASFAISIGFPDGITLPDVGCGVYQIRKQKVQCSD